MSRFKPKNRQNFFDKMLMTTPSTNRFDLSFSNKLSFNMGEIVPVMVKEIIPGDNFDCSLEHLIKVAPLVTPVMHKVKIDFHAFFVPNRLHWKNFEKFQAYDTLNDIPPHPYYDPVTISSGGIEDCSLLDYLGVPTITSDELALLGVDHPIRNLNPFPIMSYMKVIDSYFRDQNVSESFFESEDVQLGDGNITSDINSAFARVSKKNLKQRGSCIMRCWEKDYFTSCLPFAQKGQEVVLPLGESAPLVFSDARGSQMYNRNTGTPVGALDLETGSDGRILGKPGNVPLELDIEVEGYADLRQATASSVNSLRVAIRLQEFFERNAILGTRYIEQMLGKFGVKISDARAHRPEFIGSMSSMLQFSEVLQTSETDATALGQQAGHGMSINQNRLFKSYFEEHGFVLVLASVLPETSYQQGLEKQWYKKDILDYYDPMFANLGEQAVQNWELYATDPSNHMGTFGYQSRYAELKYSLSKVHGDFRKIHADWHMSRIFGELPKLSPEFVHSDPTHRIFADTDEETSRKIYAYLWFNLSGQRKIPYYSTPQLSGKIS